MPLPLDELLSTSTTDETLSTLVALAAVAGFPAYSWQSGTVPRTFFELEALTYADLTQVIGAIASGGFVDYAEGPWLTLRAAQGYNLQRTPAGYARGALRLTDDGGVGPVALTAPNQVIALSGDRRFRLVDSDEFPLPRTLPVSGSVVAMFEAEVPGIGGNLPDGAIFETTSLPGVSAEQEASSDASWLLRPGTEEESDNELRQRCKARWSSDGGAATEAAYKIITVKASDLTSIPAAQRVSRVSVDENKQSGVVTIYVASDLGAVESEVITAITPSVQALRPQCVRVSIVSANPRTVPLSGVVRAQAATLNAAKASVENAVRAYFSTIPIGGYRYTNTEDMTEHRVVYLAPIEALILRASAGILNVYVGEFFNSINEFPVDPYDVPVPSFDGIRWVTS